MRYRETKGERTRIVRRSNANLYGTTACGTALFLLSAIRISGQLFVIRSSIALRETKFRHICNGTLDMRRQVVRFVTRSIDRDPAGFTNVHFGYVSVGERSAATGNERASEPLALSAKYARSRNYTEGLSHSSSAVVIAYQRSFVSVAICPTCSGRLATRNFSSVASNDQWLH